MVFLVSLVAAFDFGFGLGFALGLTLTPFRIASRISFDKEKLPDAPTPVLRTILSFSISFAIAKLT